MSEDGYQVDVPWFSGLVAPCALVVYGVLALVRQSAVIIARIHFDTVKGVQATAIGIAALGFAVFLHCYFWRPTKRTWWLYGVGQYVGIATGAGGLIWFLYLYIFG